MDKIFVANLDFCLFRNVQIHPTRAEIQITKCVIESSCEKQVHLIVNVCNVFKCIINYTFVKTLLFGAFKLK